MTNTERNIQEIKDKLDNGGVKAESDPKILVLLLVAVITSLGTLATTLLERMMTK